MMRDHTTLIPFELTGPGGKNPTVTPSTSAQQTFTFYLNSLPVGARGKFWMYVAAGYFKLVTVFDQAASGGSAVNADKLWKCMATFMVRSPILGELCAHRNTRGAVLGNAIMPVQRAYHVLPCRAQIASTDGDTTVTLYYRLPCFALRYLKKPHETAPWTGLLEGGLIEGKLDLSTVLDGDSTGAVLKTTTSARCALGLIPSPEATVHVPHLYREFILPGSNTRHEFPDMGAADGLNGVDSRQGWGVDQLHYLTDATGAGLSGADGADNITGYDIPWRDIPRQDFVEVPFLMQDDFAARHAGPIGGMTTQHPQNGYPYTMAATPNGDANDAQAYVFPFISPGPHLETSKVQTVQGSKEINVAYTSVPSGVARFLAHGFFKFEQGFAEGLKDYLLGGRRDDALLVPKLLNKQDPGGVNDGKIAYVRQKVLMGAGS